METVQLEEPTTERVTTWKGNRYVDTLTGPMPIQHWRMVRWLNTLDDEALDDLCMKVTAPNSQFKERQRRLLMELDMGEMTPIEYIMWLSPHWAAGGLPNFADPTKE